MSVINTNVSAMQAQSSLRTTGLNQSTAMERLSTGTRINSAKDDAAGLAISTRMTASIRGISAAIRNANDGISLTQTAEGSLAQIGDNLQRIRELAVQSANTGNNASDRAAMNNEAKQLIAEIDRVASNTTFNGIKLLDGTFQNQALQVGAGNDANDRISISVGSAKSSALGVGSNSSYTTSVSGGSVGSSALAAGALAINGFSVGPAVSDGVSSSSSNTSGIAVAAAINAISGNTGVTATVSATTTTGTAVTGAGTAINTGDIKINGVDIGALAIADDAAERGGQVAAAINAKTSQTGVTAAFNTSTGAVSLTAADGRNIEVVSKVLTTVSGLGTGATAASADYAPASADYAAASANYAPASADYAPASADYAPASANYAPESEDYTPASGADPQVGTAQVGTAQVGTAQVGTAQVGTAAVGTAQVGTPATVGTATARSSVTLSSTASAGITVTGQADAGLLSSGLTAGFREAASTAGAGVSSLDLTTAAGSQAALTTLDAAINTVTDSRAAMGAYQNRLTASISNLETTSTNLSASRSRILDTDYAKETTNLAKAQIISQAATAMLAQANQSGQSVLALLK